MRNKRPTVYHSEILKKVMEEMDKDPWYKKLRRSIRVHVWVWVCLRRKYWDKSFEGYIFKR